MSKWSTHDYSQAGLGRKKAKKQLLAPASRPNARSVRVFREVAFLECGKPRHRIVQGIDRCCIINLIDLSTRPWLIEQSYTGGAIEVRLRTSHQAKLKKSILNCRGYEQGGNMTERKASETPCIQTLSYPGCIEAARAIVPFIRQFDVDSAACAIFCINSWHENRSSQNSATSTPCFSSIDAFRTRRSELRVIRRFFSRAIRKPSQRLVALKTKLCP